MSILPEVSIIIPFTDAEDEAQEVSNGPRLWKSKGRNPDPE